MVGRGSLARLSGKLRTPVGGDDGQGLYGMGLCSMALWRVEGDGGQVGSVARSCGMWKEVVARWGLRQDDLTVRHGAVAS
eukprot:1158553-Pelagomonas_calceolata.AAC.2